MSEFMVPVRTELAPAQYKHLHAVAQEHNTTVGALVAELVRRQLTPAKPGPKSRYTTALGEQVWEARRFHRSYSEAAAELGVSPQTAQRWLRRYEAELRATQQQKAGKAA